MLVGKRWLLRKCEKWRTIMPLTEMVSNVEAEDLREEDAIALERGLASGS